MSSASSSTWSSQAPDGVPDGAPCRSPAVVRGIRLVGVVKGFARSVLGLGLVMSGAVARLKHEGADPYSANAGFDFRGVLSLLQRAVLMADALKARLRTPAVMVAMARFAVGRASARDQRPRAAPPEPDDTLSRIVCVRTDDRLRRNLRQAIEEMSDREVLTHIYADLRRASAMLGETDVAAEVEALARKASALLDAADEAAAGDVAEGDVAPATAAARPEAHGRPDEGSDPDRTPGAQPAVREVGRGPP